MNSANREVGLFAKTFFSNLLALDSPTQFYALTSKELPFKVSIKKFNPAHILEFENFSARNTPHNFEGGDADILDSIAYCALAQTIKPDIIHISSIFEGYTDPVALPSHSQKAVGQIFSATLYDLTPLRFQEKYLQDPDLRKWYLERTSWLVNADLLLVTSESTKEDAINLLGIEPWRIVTIEGGIRERSKDFSWERTAQLAHEAFTEAVNYKREQGKQCALSGWLPRKRIAILSALSQNQSQTSDFLKGIFYLRRHFDIDLYLESEQIDNLNPLSGIRIFKITEFALVANSYDIIVYELIHSKFNAQLLSLLKRYKGVVILHENYLENFANNTDINTKLDLPSIKNVLENAIGIISYSPYNLEFARKYFKEGWLAPFHTINQMLLCKQCIASEEQLKIRTELGFKTDDFIITVFGFSTWTECNDDLLNAFINLHNEHNAYLIFVRAISEDVTGEAQEHIVGFNNRVRITHSFSVDLYKKYKQITNLTVQLDTKDQGNTLKELLNSLSFGIPVLINQDKNHSHYLDNAVLKLSGKPTIDEMSEKLSQLMLDQKQLSTYSRDGLKYIKEHHNPIEWAAIYAAAIHEFIEREKRIQPHYWVDAFAPYLSACDNIKKTLKDITTHLRNLPQPRFERRRFYIDVSYIANIDHQTGIQRVVREITHSLYSQNIPGVEPIAVEQIGGRLTVAEHWLYAQGLIATPPGIGRKPIEFSPGDILLMLDSSWSTYTQFYPIFKKAKQAQASIYTAIYDLVPITLSSFSNVDTDMFRSWVHSAISASDGLVCISKSVADEVIHYMAEQRLTRSGLKVGYWHLGANFMRKEQSCLKIPANIAPYLLMIGTIEPRKSYNLALAAMEKLWEQGFEVNLCIAGKEGWMVEDLMQKLRNHPARNKKLFLYEKPTDDDIASLYENACGLMFLSKGEGFGLPLIEAAQYGVPIICSNIPIFHEIAGEHATYVTIESPIETAKAIENWWQRQKMNDLPDSKKIQYLSWQESAGKLLEVTIDQSWYWSQQ